MECEILVKSTGSKCILEEYVEEDYYARFDTHIYHRYREIQFNARRCKIMTKPLKRKI